MVQCSKINVLRLAHVHYQLPDIERATSFLKDFGFVEAERHGSKIYFRGFGTQPYVYIAEPSPTSKRAFLGGAWVVESEEDLKLAAAQPRATQIRPNIGPGGGSIVTMTDPNGQNVSFLHGQKLPDRPPQEKIDCREPEYSSTAINTAFEKTRRGQFQRFKQGPSPIHKLGHYGFSVPKSQYEKTVLWYTDLMNLKPTDAVFDPVSGKDTTCFFHIDRGIEYSDHHSFFIAAGPEDRPAHIHHASFEVNDFDSQTLGHDWLRAKGWTNCWGIGRHVLGSQIFDYWFDSCGNVIEHYSDGDLVNEDTPFTREPAAPNTLYIWGPNIPLAFITGKVEDAIMRNTPSSEKIGIHTSPPDPFNSVPEVLIA